MEYVSANGIEHQNYCVNSVDCTTTTGVSFVGCIFMEWMDWKHLFPGRDHIHKLRILVKACLFGGRHYMVIFFK